MREVQKKIGKDKMAVLLLDNSHRKGKRFKRFRKRAEKFFADSKLDLPWQRVLVPGGSDTIHKTFNKSGYGLILVDPEGRVVSTTIHGKQLGFVLNKSTVKTLGKTPSKRNTTQADAPEEAPRLEAAKPIRRQDGAWEIALHLTLPPGWHVYGSKEKSGEPVKLKVLECGGLTVARTAIPAGDPVTKNGRTSYQLEDEVILKAVFTLPPGTKKTTHEVRGSVRFMMCDDKRCLPPTEISWRSEIRVSPAGT